MVIRSKIIWWFWGYNNPCIDNRAFATQSSEYQPPTLHPKLHIVAFRARKPSVEELSFRYHSKETMAAYYMSYTWTPKVGKMIAQNT